MATTKKRTTRTTSPASGEPDKLVVRKLRVYYADGHCEHVTDRTVSSLFTGRLDITRIENAVTDAVVWPVGA